MGKRFLVVLGCVAAALVTALPVAASGRLAYTEAVAADGSLTVTFNEPSQKKFASVTYELDAQQDVVWACSDGTSNGRRLFPSNATTVEPVGNGHALGSISLGAPPVTSSNCTSAATLQQIVYTNVTLTNVTTGDVYPLDSISRTFP